jgi:signal transduction histidine kinase
MKIYLVGADHLLKNALEAIGKNQNGKIHLKAEYKNDKIGWVNRGIEISLIDNGPGIPDELMEHIFTPFFTTREKGSGIGLSLSRQIMKLTSGTIHS